MMKAHRPMIISFSIIIAVATLMIVMAYLYSPKHLATAQERPRPRPGSETTTPNQPAPEARSDDGPGPIPKDDQLYIWPLPEQGTQSLVVLRIVDGDTVEAAFMVPVIVRIRGINAPESNTKEGKAAAEAMEKLIGGKLLAANLKGREKYGRLLADFWLGEKDGGWLSSVLIKQGHAKPYNPVKGE